MDKISIYSLESSLSTVVITKSSSVLAVQTEPCDPLYEIYTENIGKATLQQPQEDHETPNWVTERLRIGVFGEKVAESYLKHHYSDVKNVTKDSWKGYDLEASTGDSRMYIEVKTTYTSNCFYLSINELIKANLYGDSYYIFFIKICNKSKKIHGYLIKNPISTLSIPFNYMTKLFQSPSVYVQPCNFILELSPNQILVLEEGEICLNDYAGSF
ncbi:hypothetical protein J31TS4_17260 [Paenibacillus sp. J31TS4]|uniref:DUF3883 domain-containing protein n=1 Tax=Paenibacillus sp. J31TS4 TaxID=2807195 RepID=UPI001B13E168|nr:DUF3883 domain-containing protein [Paenibacillus sp. J31TS4]GIP38446.1 hypothetical protein J31TS4_17260 [Paenibacillus sp. J31TS4]